MTSVSVIKDIFRGEAVDSNQNKQDECQSGRRAIESILRSRDKEVEGVVFLRYRIVRMG